MKRHNGRARGFTLIELLVVVTIIGLLAAILIPAVNKALNTAKKTRAMSQIRDLDGAIKRYFAEYGKMPVPAGFNGDKTKEKDPFLGKDQAAVIEILIGANTNFNSRKISFLDLDPSAFRVKTVTEMMKALQVDGAPYRDPWWNPASDPPGAVRDYGIFMDLNFDGKIEGTPYGDLRTTVAVYSRGENNVAGDPPYKTW